MREQSHLSTGSGAERGQGKGQDFFFRNIGNKIFFVFYQPNRKGVRRNQSSSPGKYFPKGLNNMWISV